MDGSEKTMKEMVLKEIRFMFSDEEYGFDVFVRVLNIRFSNRSVNHWKKNSLMKAVSMTRLRISQMKKRMFSM